MIREVNVGASEPGGLRSPAPMMRAKTMSASADESLPVEAGKAPIVVNVTVTVQMTK